ncbi:MAG: ribosomal RNA small subunit methyltransferase A, partial [bacterium]
MVPELSQVLLSDENWLQRINFRINPAEFGVEWACGRGALTGHLVDKWDCLLGIELDDRFCEELVNKFKNACFYPVRADILNYPLPKKISPYPLVSNLPYHLTGPLLIKILRNSPKLKSFQGLVQKEVAERITAKPNDKQYGSISLLFDLCGEVCNIYQVPASAFSPAPAVDSCWIEFFP